MKKLMFSMMTASCVAAISAMAQEPVEAVETEEAAEIEEEESSIGEIGLDFDFFSAYVWRNAVQNDRMVMQPCVWGELTAFEPLSLGFFIWQNYDLTARRHGTYRHALTETDYNIHAGLQAWASEEEEYTLSFELGHDWYTYQDLHGEARADNPDTRELYLKATLTNPFVDIYGQVSWMYDNEGHTFEGQNAYRPAVHYELGFNKEIEACDTLTLGADWNVNFGDSRYLAFLYGGSSNPYVDEDGEIADDYDGSEFGFGGTTIKLYASWAITEWMSLKGTIAYTGLLNSKLRESIGDQAADYDFNGDSYPRDLLWGGISLNIAF